MIHKIQIGLAGGSTREGQCNVRTGPNTKNPRVDVDITIPGLRASLYVEAAEMLAHDLLAAVAFAKRLRGSTAWERISETRFRKSVAGSDLSVEAYQTDGGWAWAGYAGGVRVWRASGSASDQLTAQAAAERWAGEQTVSLAPAQ